MRSSPTGSVVAPDIASYTGMFAAIASIGPSFDRGLMPRNTVDQAAVTGIMSAINFGLVTTGQSAIESAARWVSTKLGRRPGEAGHIRATRAGLLVEDLAGIAIGYGLTQGLAEREGESLRRAAARGLAQRTFLGSTSGAATVTTLALADRVDPDRRVPRTPFIIAAGAATTAGLYAHNRTKARRLHTPDETSDTGRDPLTIRAGRTLATGAAVSGTLIGLAAAERTVSGSVAGAIRAARPDAALLARPIGHAVALGAAGFGLYQGGKRLYASADVAGNAVEAAYREVPDSPYVSGSAGSLVSWNDIGREGRRFVNMALTAEDIERVVGEPALDPLRAFVGLASAPIEIERTDLALRELERMGAFDRKYIAIFSPTGTGYVNYVAMETLEYHTRGDVASVCVQYSVRPSGLSLDRVAEGRRQIKNLTNALGWRLRGIPESKRPKVLLFGESLGSWAAVDAFMQEGINGPARAGIDRALMVGTPGIATWTTKYRENRTQFDPDGLVIEFDSYEELLAYDVDRLAAARIFLLSHHNDPVVKLDLEIAIRQPAWLGPPETRAPGVPREVAWRPIYNFVSLLFDFKNSMAVKPGLFVRYGHDYRTDLGRVVPVALGLPPVNGVQQAAIERALREREMEWAVLREGAERLADAERTFRERLATMGIPPDSIPTLVADPDYERLSQAYTMEALEQAEHQAEV